MRNAVSAAAAMLKAIHAGEDLAAAREGHPSDREAAWRLARAAELVKAANSAPSPLVKMAQRAGW